MASADKFIGGGQAPTLRVEAFCRPETIRFRACCLSEKVFDGYRISRCVHPYVTTSRIVCSISSGSVSFNKQRLAPALSAS